MKPRHKRALVIIGALATLAIAATLILNALNSNIALYVTPSEVAAGKAPTGQTFRIGGLVKSDSLRRDELVVHFIITDLFKEGKGAVVQGKLDGNGQFVASEVLAKHDENYMPPEAKQALEQAQKNGAK